MVKYLFVCGRLIASAFLNDDNHFIGRQRDVEMQFTIIDATVIETQCGTVWDLQYIPNEKKRKLAIRIDNLISANTVPLDHWNLLLLYLLNTTPERTQQEAKDTLVRLLQQENQ